jgi:hypothetical protein
MYNEEPTVFTPQQIAAMFFSKMRDLVQVSTGLKGCDMVLSVPPYYTDAQRHAVLDACKIGVRYPFTLAIPFPRTQPCPCAVLPLSAMS